MYLADSVFFPAEHRDCHAAAERAPCAQLSRGAVGVICPAHAPGQPWLHKKRLCRSTEQLSVPSRAPAGTVATAAPGSATAGALLGGERAPNSAQLQESPVLFLPPELQENNVTMGPFRGISQGNSLKSSLFPQKTSTSLDCSCNNSGIQITIQ